MIYKNIEVFGAAELIECDGGGVTWLRVPSDVDDKLEHGNQSHNMARCSTGVELRFVINSGESASITLAKATPGLSTSVFHVYRGGIQGGWEDHECDKYVGDEPHDFVISRSPNMDTLKRMAKDTDDEWSPEVIRIIFDRGAYRIIDVKGDVRPPYPSERPKNTVLFYGSSITHGSNSIDASHAWPSVVGHNLNMDVRNLGLAGACAMEPAMIEYIASLGQKGEWNMCVMELGINVLGWEDEKIYERATNAIRTVADKNPNKPVVVISPFYSNEDYEGGTRAQKWRNILAEIVKREGLANVTYIDGPDLLGDISGLSGDVIHPNIYGVEKIAGGLTRILRECVLADKGRLL